MIECKKCGEANSPKRVFCVCGAQLRLRSEEELKSAPTGFYVVVDEKTGLVMRRIKKR